MIKTVSSSSKKSTPSKEIIYNPGGRRRSSVWQPVKSVITKSLTAGSLDKMLKSGTGSTNHAGLDTSNLSLTQKITRSITRETSINFSKISNGSTEVQSKSEVESDSESNRFCEFVVDTYVLNGPDFNCWNWPKLVEKVQRVPSWTLNSIWLSSNVTI